MLAYAVVYALVVAAEQNQIPLERELVGYALSKDLSVRGEVYNLVVVALRLQLFDHTVNRLDHKDHSGIPAVTVVVHLEARTLAVFAQVVDLYFYYSLLPRPSHDGMAQRAFQQLRHYGNYVYSHLRFRFWLSACKNSNLSA